MSKNVILFGSTGFVGECLLKHFTKREYQVITPVRKVQSELDTVNSEQIKFDLSQIDSNQNQTFNLENKIKELGKYTIIYSVGLLREDSNQKYSDFHYKWIKELLKLIEFCPPEKFILISALGVDDDNIDQSTYYGSKRLGELELINSGLNYSIVRPSIIWDDEGSDKYSFKKVIESLTNLPVVPVIGSGKYKFQPIYRSNLALLIETIVRGKSIDYAIDEADVNIVFAVGEEVFTLKQLLKKQAKGLKLYIHIPLVILSFAVKLFGNFKFFPISKQQLDMLVEGNALTSK
jgi:NADH dehydrogenase